MIKLEKDDIRNPEEVRYAAIDELIQLRKIHDKIVFVDSDLSEPSGSIRFKKEYPDHFINVGIMEAHMVGFAAGLCIGGYQPFVHSFAPFASRRSFDQSVIAGAYSRNAITLMATDPGLCAQYNGGTHTTLEDIGMFRSLSDTIVLDIADTTQVRWAMKFRVENPQDLAYIRYPRRPLRRIYAPGSQFRLGQFPIVHEGKDITIFASGIMTSLALDAAESLAGEGIGVQVVDCFSISHPDVDTIVKEAESKRPLLALDNHNVRGGLASTIADVLVTYCPAKLHRMGAERFGQVGTLKELLDVYGLDAEHIVKKVKSLI